MRAFCLILSIFVASCSAINPTEDDLAFKASFDEALKKAGMTPRMFEAEIIAKIEEIISQIPTWIPYQPINITVLNETLVANGFLENTTLAGLDKHVIDNVKFSVLPLSANLHVVFDDVLVSGYYDIIATLVNLIPIYGNGDFQVGATGVEATVHVDMTSLGGYLSVTNLVFEFNVGDVTFQFDNFLGGDLGVVVGELIEDNFTEYIDRIFYWYGDQITSFIKSNVNVFLSDKTVNDLINWIQGKTTAPPATTIPSLRFV